MEESVRLLHNRVIKGHEPLDMMRWLAMDFGAMKINVLYIEDINELEALK